MFFHQIIKKKKISIHESLFEDTLKFIKEKN